MAVVEYLLGVCYTAPTMPFDFDDDQMSQQEQSSQPPQQETPPPPVKTQTAQGPRPRDLEEMDEIELKMAKAQYYWELMGSELLDTSDPLAEEVQNEVYQFLRQKLSELMGSGGTKRRKKTVAPEKPLWRPSEAVKRTVRHPAAKKWSRPARVTEAVPTGSTETGEEIVQSVTAPDGSLFEKVYRKFVDNDSQKVYYRAYVKDVTGKLVSDGNKYELALNSSGGQYFRVWSQQTLPSSKASFQTKQQLEAESNAHAAASLAALRTSLDDSGGIGKLLGAAISLAQKEE